MYGGGRKKSKGVMREGSIVFLRKIKLFSMLTREGST